MSAFNIFGKPMETVDIGQEIDYAGYEWFKDPPPPAAQMAQMVRVILYPGAWRLFTLRPFHFSGQPCHRRTVRPATWRH